MSTITQKPAEDLAKIFDGDGMTTDYWKFDSANGRDEIIIIMTKAPKGRRMLLKSAAADSYWVSSGPTGSVCACCGGSGRG